MEGDKSFKIFQDIYKLVRISIKIDTQKFDFIIAKIGFSFFFTLIKITSIQIYLRVFTSN